MCLPSMTRKEKPEAGCQGEIEGVNDRVNHLHVVRYTICAKTLPTWSLLYCTVLYWNTHQSGYVVEELDGALKSKSYSRKSPIKATPTDIDLDHDSHYQAGRLSSSSLARRSRLTAVSRQGMLVRLSAYTLNTVPIPPKNSGLSWGMDEPFRHMARHCFISTIDVILIIKTHMTSHRLVVT